MVLKVRDGLEDKVSNDGGAEIGLSVVDLIVGGIVWRSDGGGPVTVGNTPLQYDCVVVISGEGNTKLRAVSPNEMTLVTLARAIMDESISDGGAAEEGAEGASVDEEAIGMDALDCPIGKLEPLDTLVIKGAEGLLVERGTEVRIVAELGNELRLLILGGFDGKEATLVVTGGVGTVLWELVVIDGKLGLPDVVNLVDSVGTMVGVNCDVAIVVETGSELGVVERGTVLVGGNPLEDGMEG